MRRFLENRLQLTLPINRVAGGMNTRWCDRTHRNGYIAFILICYLAGTNIIYKINTTRTIAIVSNSSKTDNDSKETSSLHSSSMITKNEINRTASMGTSSTIKAIPSLEAPDPSIRTDEQQQQHSNGNDDTSKSQKLPSIDAINDFYHSQAGQDKWIFEKLMLSDLDRYRHHGGFFIEFGARNGVDDSNTYFFEHFLGWKGLLIEANPSELQDIVSTRPDSAIISGAICSSDSVTFLYTGISGLDGDKASYDSERYKEIQHRAKEVQVKCYTLDYLTQYLQLDEVDIMTVDTEGSELSALQTFPFERIQPKLIAVELLVGNAERDEDRNKLESFMKTKGYKVCTYIVHYIMIR